ncbi:MAG: hypothetical protein AAB035_00190 [Nitrospirota bacterium]
MDDKKFISRSIQTAILFSVALFPFLSQKFEPAIVWGFFSGVLLSVGNLHLIAMLAAMFFSPRASGSLSPRKVFFYASLKLPIFYAILIFLLNVLHFSVVAVMAGFSVVLLVVILKSIGSMLLGWRDYARTSRAA